MTSSNVTSETEAGLPGGNFRPRFSLYSTDTEEQVISVNRGLDRCAALLKNLLSPERDSNGQLQEEDNVAKQHECGGYQYKDKEHHQPNTLSSRLTTQRTTQDHKPTQPLTFERKEGQKHTHPHASSTPISNRDHNHYISSPRPRALNDLVIQLPTHHPEDTIDSPPDTPTIETNQAPEVSSITQQNVLHSPGKGGRAATTSGQKGEIGRTQKTKRAHRKQPVEPRKPFVVSRNPPKLRPLVGIRVKPKVASKPRTCTPATTALPTCTPSTRNSMAQKHSVTTVTTPSACAGEESSTVPTPTPSHHPPLCRLSTPLPYFHYFPPPSSLSSLPYPSWPSPESASRTGDNGQPPPWLPCVPLWLTYNNRLASGPNKDNKTTSLTVSGLSNVPPLYTPALNSELTTSAPPTLSTNPAALSTSLQSSTATSLATCTPLSTSRTSPLVMATNVSTESSPVKEKQKWCNSAPLRVETDNESGLGKDLDEVEKCLMMEVAHVEERLKETGHPELVSSLNRLKSCLSEQCRQAQQQEPLSKLPTSHWLRQISQLEQEKSQLLQQVIESESAYSKVMGQLEQAKREKTLFHDQVDAHRRELEALREDLQSTKKALSLLDSQHTITKGEYLEASRLAEAQTQRLMEENKRLKEQVNHLETDLSKSKRECLGFPERLSELQLSMEMAQEELAMIRVTIAEKDTQLLQAQDQLLGSRQCLAHLLSQLKPVIDNNFQRGHLLHDRRYTISSQLVDKLHSLINDGDVDKFLLETSKCSSRLESAAQDRSSCSDSNSTVTEAELENTLKEFPSDIGHMNTPRGPASLSTVSNQVITPLNLSMEQNSPQNHNDPTVTTSSDQSTLTSSQFNPFPSLSLSQKSNGSTTANTPSPKATSLLTSGSSLSQGLDTQSCRTTASEIDFRRDLASLDADIARLQIQFRVALQSSS